MLRYLLRELLASLWREKACAPLKTLAATAKSVSDEDVARFLLIETLISAQVTPPDAATLGAVNVETLIKK